MRKQYPNQRPKRDVDRMMPLVPHFTERKQRRDTQWGKEQDEFPVMHSPTQASLLRSTLSVPRRTVVISKMPTSRQHLELRIQPERQKSEACKRRTRVSRREAHLRLFDLLFIAIADLFRSVVSQIAIRRRDAGCNDREDGLADGEKVGTESADEDLDEALEKRCGGECVA
jgi:hypothetical protein